MAKSIEGRNEWGSDAVTRARIALVQPELVQGDIARQRRVVDDMVAQAAAAGAHFAIVPDVLGIAGHALIVALGTTQIQSASDDLVLMEGDFGSLSIGLDKHVSHCDMLALDGTQAYVFSGRKLVLWGKPTAVVRSTGMLNVGQIVTAYQGESYLQTGNGRVCARLRADFQPDMQVVQFCDDEICLDEAADHLLEALEATIARFDDQVLSWKPKWVIGLSGGLDSSVVATLLVRALGSDRVIGYNLATRYNSDATKANAAGLAAALGIELRNGSIEDLVAATASTLARYGYDADAQPSLVHENIQARLRGHMLSTFAAVEGGVVANNGNRVECALGYATLYGDAIGALAPIADLTKVQLFGLSLQINGAEGREVIPENLLPVETDEGLRWQTAPSAELSDGQKDPMKWFYHDWLIEQIQYQEAGGLARVMQGYATDKLESLGMGKWVRFYGLDKPEVFISDLEWVLRSMHNAAFKRIQSPPAIKLASPLTVAPPAEVQAPFVPSQAYQELKATILSL